MNREEIERIEESALEFAKAFSDLYEQSNYGSMYVGFKEGAKWMYEQMIKKENTIILCDVCGEEFSYPHKGQLQQGFGICDECGKK
jgi:hypothetical protein